MAITRAVEVMEVAVRGSAEAPGEPDVIASVRNASKRYELKNQPQVTAVHEVTLDVPRGEFIVITGRSGSGKTTLLNLMAGLTRPTAGEVWFESVNLWNLPDGKRSRLRNESMGFIFQFPSLLPSLTALENVVLPTLFGPKEGRAGTSASERAAELLEEVGLADKISSYPRQLSAGQQKRAVIARSLINSPRLILADEPTSDLDEQTEAEFMAVLARMREATGVTIRMVTHNRQLIAYGTRAIEMASGRIVS